jgi:membrane associated rhomboid family serine protease
MLIIPLARKLDWRRPPLITLLLILANLLIYAVSEHRDQQSFERAVRYFLHSPLAQIEPPLYIRYLHDERSLEEEQRLREALRQGEDGVVEVLEAIQDDPGFLALLHASRIVTPSAPRYAEWRNARREFDSLWQDRVAERYGFVPAHHAALTFVTCQFMHGSWAHVIGNMVVLFVVGFMVEAALGWWRFLAGYLLTGVAAAAVFWAAHPDSSTPLIGASGAVSGVVGMYTAIFGLRRIDFFYFVLVYFDYVKAPALIVLGLWVGNEAFQLTDSESHVAISLAGGSGVRSAADRCGACCRQRGSRVSGEVDATQRRRPSTSALDAGRAALRCRLRNPSDRLVDSHPDDLELVLQSYNVASTRPPARLPPRGGPGAAERKPRDGRDYRHHLQRLSHGETVPCYLCLASRVELARKFAERGRMVEGGCALAGRARKRLRRCGRGSAVRRRGPSQRRQSRACAALAALRRQALPEQPGRAARAAFNRCPLSLRWSGRGRWTPDTLAPAQRPDCADTCARSLPAAAGLPPAPGSSR